MIIKCHGQEIFGLSFSMKSSYLIPDPLSPYICKPEDDQLSVAAGFIIQKGHEFIHEKRRWITSIRVNQAQENNP